MSDRDDTENYKKSLSELTSDQIIDLIVQKSLTKGDKLDNEKTLCEKLNVGRSTLREAVRMLASRNILEVRHGSGIYVSEKLGIPDDPLGFTFVQDKKKLVSDLLAFRRMIEPPVCALAAINASKEQIEKLETKANEVEALILAEKNHHKADASFHSLIGELSGNTVMPKIQPIIFKAIELFVDVTGSMLRKETIKDHRNLVDAIRMHDPVKASDAMFLHLIHNMEAIDSHFH